MFRNFNFENASFWLGVLTGILISWILHRSRILLPDLKKWLSQKSAFLGRNLTRTSEFRLREDTIRHVQRIHLAASLFSLDEIVVEPRLMAPPLRAELDSESVFQDITWKVIPYMPDFPEISSCYGAPTISMTEGIAAGANIVVTGIPGSGKSTALAYLAYQLSRQSLDFEVLENRIPLFVHVLDLQLSNDGNEITTPLVNALCTYASPLSLPRLSSYIHSLVQSGKALLILDGLDERTIDESRETLQWLSELIRAYPTLQIITAALANNNLGLNKLGFRPLAIAAWDRKTTRQFYDQWTKQWTKHIAELSPGIYEQIDPRLLNQWLNFRCAPITPFQATLTAWELFAGDLRSDELAGLIDSFLLRATTQTPNSYHALQNVALQMVLDEKSYLSNDEFRLLASEYETLISMPVNNEPLQSVPDNGEQQQQGPYTRSSKTSPALSGSSQMVSLFLTHNLLVNHPNSQLRFSHILFTTFLAGRATASLGNVTVIMSQPDWYGKWGTIGFTGCFADISNPISILLAQSREDFLARNLLQMARWLSFSPIKAPWRTTLLRALTTLVQEESATPGIAARAVCAIGLADEPSTGILFRQWLERDDPDLRCWGALGCGMVMDIKAVRVLELLHKDPYPKIAKAACLALVAIGNATALEAVDRILFQGPEQIRRAAAEALAINESEGLRILNERSKDADTLVRRSIVFGFLRSKKPEFVGLLERMAVEDQEWVVRNAASHALEIMRDPNPHVPKPPTPVTEIPWLIDYAGKLGIGLQAGKPMQDLICTVIEEGDEKEKLLALEHVCQYGGDYAIPVLYKQYINSRGEMHQAIFDALHCLAASGANIPSFGQIEAMIAKKTSQTNGY